MTDTVDDLDIVGIEDSLPSASCLSWIWVTSYSAPVVGNGVGMSFGLSTVGNGAGISLALVSTNDTVAEMDEPRAPDVARSCTGFSRVSCLLLICLRKSYSGKDNK